MTEKDIRPIPNYIMKEIYKRDMKSEPWQTSMVRYYAYLTVWKKELIKVTVLCAVKIPDTRHISFPPKRFLAAGEPKSAL